MSATITSRVQDILDRGAGTSLVELAWAHVQEPVVVRELYAVMRRREPRLALEFARVRFLQEEQYRRQDTVYRREMYETVEALGGTPAVLERFVPYLVAHADVPSFSLVLGRLGDDRAIPALLARLSTAKGPLLAAVIDAVGRLKAAEAVDDLIAKAHSVLPRTEGDRQSYRRVVSNACLALGRIGDERAMAALTTLVTDTPPDMDSVVARAIVGLGWLGDDSATHALLPMLEGRHRNVSMYALARIADRASASHVEAVAARLSGNPEQLVYPRLMLEALRSRLGRVVDLNVVRYALTVVMASRFEAAELHETALRIMAVHADPTEIVPVARRFVDAEHPRVREAATSALASAGIAIEPTWLDRPKVEDLYRREGVRGFAAALSSPDAVFRHNVLRKAAEVECGAEIEGPALTTLRTMVAFPTYSEDEVQDRHESTFEALEASARFHTAAADTFLIGLLEHPNVMIRACAIEIAKVDVYGASERFREALRERPTSRDVAKPTLPFARLGGGPWIFGPPIRHLAVDRTGSRFAALGDQKLVVFDADGTVVRGLDLEAAAALAFERNGDRVAAVSARGKARIVEARTGDDAPVARDPLPGVTRVSAVSFAADGRLIAGTSAGRLVKESGWSHRLEGPIVALVPNPDAPHVLVASGGRAIWIDERDGSERATSRAGAAVVDVAFHGPSAGAEVAILRAAAVELCDAATLDRRRRIAVLGGKRVVFARDGKVLVISVGGKQPGLVRIDLPDGDATRIVRTPRAHSAIAVDPITSHVLAGGDGVRVDLWDLGGTSSSLPIAQHTAPVDVVVADIARGRTFSIGADGLVLQWDGGTREIVAGWRLPRVGPVVGAATGATGRTLVVAWSDALCILDLVTGTPRYEASISKIRSIARLGAIVWLVTDKGLFAFDEAKALDPSKKRSNPLRLARASTKSGTLVPLDDHRVVLVNAAVALVLDERTAEPLDRVVLGKSKVVCVTGGGEAGLVVAYRDGKVSRFAGAPLEPVASARIGPNVRALALDEGSERVAAAFGDEVVVLEANLTERARVRLEHAISSLTFAERGLLVCGGQSGEVSVVETER